MHVNLARFVVPEKTAGLGGVIRRATAVGVGRPGVERILQNFGTSGHAANALRRLTKETGRAPAAAVPPPDLAARLATFKANKPVPAPAPPTFLDRMAAEAERAPAILPKSKVPGLVLGGAAAAAGTGAAIAGGVPGMASDAASTVAAIPGRIATGVDNIMQAGAAPPTAAPTAAPTLPSELQGNPIWKYLPHAGLAAAGGLGLYAMYQNSKKQEEQAKQVPLVNMLPKTAAEQAQFATDYPFVTGFLVACHDAGLDELQIREKIAIAARIDVDFAEEFHNAFVKEAIGLGGPTGLPDLTKPLPASQIAPKPVSLPNAPSPKSVPAPSPSLLEGLSSMKAPRDPASMGPQPMSAADVNARTAWRQQGSQGPEPLPANPHWDAPAMTALGTAVAAPLAGGAAALAAANPTVSGVVAPVVWRGAKAIGNEFLANEGVNAGVNVATGQNPFAPKNTVIGSAVNAVKQTPHEYLPTDLSPDMQARIAAPAFQEQLRAQAAAELGPNASPSTVAARVAEMRQATINGAMHEQLTSKPQTAPPVQAGAAPVTNPNAAHDPVGIESGVGGQMAAAEDATALSSQAPAGPQPGPGPAPTQTPPQPTAQPMAPPPEGVPSTASQGQPGAQPPGAPQPGMTAMAAPGPGSPPQAWDEFAKSITDDPSTPVNEKLDAIKPFVEQVTAQSGLPPEEIAKFVQQAETQGLQPSQLQESFQRYTEQLAASQPDAMNQPGFVEQAWETFKGMDGGTQALLGLGLGLGVIGLLNSANGGNGMASILMSLLGFGTAAFTGAQGGLFGEGAKGMAGSLSESVGGLFDSQTLPQPGEGFQISPLWQQKLDDPNSDVNKTIGAKLNGGLGSFGKFVDGAMGTNLIGSQIADELTKQLHIEPQAAKAIAEAYLQKQKAPSAGQTSSIQPAQLDGYQSLRAGGNPNLPNSANFAAGLA